MTICVKKSVSERGKGRKGENREEGRERERKGRGGRERLERE